MFEILVGGDVYGYYSPSDWSPIFCIRDGKTYLVISNEHVDSVLPRKSKSQTECTATTVVAFSFEDNRFVKLASNGAVLPCNSSTPILMNINSFLLPIESYSDLVHLIKRALKLETFDAAIEETIRRFTTPRNGGFGAKGFIRAGIESGELSYRLLSELPRRVIKDHGLEKHYNDLDERFAFTEVTWIESKKY